MSAGFERKTVANGGERRSYHHHVSSERIGQVSDGGVAVSIRRLALGAVSWLVTPVNQNRGWPKAKKTKTKKTKTTKTKKLTRLSTQGVQPPPVWRLKTVYLKRVSESKFALDRYPFKVDCAFSSHREQSQKKWMAGSRTEDIWCCKLCLMTLRGLYICPVWQISMSLTRKLPPPSKQTDIQTEDKTEPIH